MPLEAPLPGLLWVRAQGSGGGPGGEGGGGAKAEGGGRGLVQGTPDPRGPAAHEACGDLRPTLAPAPPQRWWARLALSRWVLHSRPSRAAPPPPVPAGSCLPSAARTRPPSPGSLGWAGLCPPASQAWGPWNPCCSTPGFLGGRGQQGVHQDGGPDTRAGHMSPAWPGLQLWVWLASLPCTRAWRLPRAPGPCVRTTRLVENKHSPACTLSPVSWRPEPLPHQRPGRPATRSPPGPGASCGVAGTKGLGRRGQRTSVWPPPLAAKRATCPWDGRGRGRREQVRLCPRALTPPPQAPCPSLRCFGVSCSLKGPQTCHPAWAIPGSVGPSARRTSFLVSVRRLGLPRSHTLCSLC